MASSLLSAAGRSFFARMNEGLHERTPRDAAIFLAILIWAMKEMQESGQTEGQEEEASYPVT